MPNDAYFLSATNPIATSAQRDAEDLAMRLIQRPELQKARGVATFLWREGMRYPAADQMDLFERTIEEYVFHYALRAAASDAHEPHAIRFMAPAHHWFGRDVPGSRWAGDIDPVDHLLGARDQAGIGEIVAAAFALGEGEDFGEVQL